MTDRHVGRRRTWVLLAAGALLVGLLVTLALRRGSSGDLTPGGRAPLKFHVSERLSSYCLSFDPGRLQFLDRGRLLLVRSEAKAELWALNPTPTLVRSFDATGHVLCATALSDRLLEREPAGARVLDSTGRTVDELHLGVEPSGGAPRCALSPSGNLLAVETTDAIEIRAVGKGTTLRRIPFPERLGNDGPRPHLDSLAFSDEEFLHTTWRTPRLVGSRLIEVSDGVMHQNRASERLEGDEFLECSGCWAPRAWMLVVRSLDGDQRRFLKLDNPEEGAYPLLAASGKRLVMHGTTTPTIDVFSTRTGARVAHVDAARKFGWNVAVSYDGDRVAVVLDDGVVTVWDVPG